MEDQVPFKVYTYWKEGGQPEVRRFGVDRNVVSSYTYLLAKIHDVFPKLKGKIFSVSWKDEEGDDVKVSSDDEVMTMLTAVPGQLFKLYVHVEDSKESEGGNSHVINVAFAAPQQEPNPFVFSGHPAHHVGVVCDGCNHRVVGFRYKCITCGDFDLCPNCEAQGVHSEHCFVRIPSPQMSLQVVKDSIRKSRHFLKTYAASLHEAQKKQRDELKRTASTAGAAISACHMMAPGACPVYPTMGPHRSAKHEAKLAAKERREEHREERQEKRQERHEKRQERREEERRERRDNPRAGWMDVFSKYVDQFANLAADHIRVATNDTTEQTSQTGDNAHFPHFDQTEFARMMNAYMNFRDCGFNTGEPQEGSQETRDSVQAPNETNASAPSTSQEAQQISPEAQTTPQVPIQAQTPPQVATQDPTVPLVATQAPTVPLLATQAPITPQVAATSVQPARDQNTDKSDASSTSSSEGLSRGATPDKSAEDWTMINNEKDLDPDTGAGAANLVQIDINLPEEFQPRPGAAYGFIYPPLNVATAVYNPQEPVVTPAPASQASSKQPQPQPQGFSGATGSSGQAAAASASAAPRPTAPVVDERYHRVPHIDAAIRQMVAMGFTNEGGWLTQLVESKDGNIAAVLDLLTPVNPHKK